MERFMVVGEGEDRFQVPTEDDGLTAPLLPAAAGSDAVQGEKKSHAADCHVLPAA